jgi:hypothetical protein
MKVSSDTPTSKQPLHEARSRVVLPADVGPVFEVYLNGVRQQRGRDFEQRGGELVFFRPLAREGRLGLLRWTSLFLGVAGTYRKNDSVDVVYDRDGRRVVASGLPIESV